MTASRVTTFSSRALPLCCQKEHPSLRLALNLVLEQRENTTQTQVTCCQNKDREKIDIVALILQDQVYVLQQQNLGKAD